MSQMLGFKASCLSHSMSLACSCPTRSCKQPQQASTRLHVYSMFHQTSHGVHYLRRLHALCCCTELEHTPPACIASWRATQLLAPASTKQFRLAHVVYTCMYTQLKHLCRCQVVYAMKAGQSLPPTSDRVSAKLYKLEDVAHMGQQHPKAHIPPAPTDLCTICYTSGTTGALLE